MHPHPITRDGNPGARQHDPQKVPWLQQIRWFRQEDMQ
jgi:hypothetical protein